ncbi:hypothetical protein STEG23_004959 [Scotinomys teguina]
MEGFLTERKIISYNACAAQMFFLIAFATAESFLLASMAFDRHAAVCKCHGKIQMTLMENISEATEFILVGLTDAPELQIPLFIIFTFIYLFTLVGNLGMIVLILLDSRLHTPMYYFLSNLSLVDCVYASAVTPKVIEVFLTGDKIISYNACAAQMFFFAAFATIESFILASMAFDRHAAVCKPLHYSTTMTSPICVLMWSWLVAFSFVVTNPCRSVSVGPDPPLSKTKALMPTCREYPQVRIIHYMGDILLAAPSQVMLDKTYVHTVQALEKKGLYIAPEKVQKDSIDCFKNLRLLAECWNGTWTLAVIVKVPTFVPIPVEADPKTFPILTLLRERRDFGITAAIVAAIALSAASAVTAAVAMTNQIQTAQTINTVVEQTSAVMETQHRINKHLISGIVAANQRMDLIQTQIEELFGLVKIVCIAKLKHMCVTPLRFDEAGNESRMITSYLAGNWTRDAELLMSQQLLQIAALNETRVEPISLGDFTDWLSSAFSFFKEWVGVGIFGTICCFGVVLRLWFLCRL